MKTLRQYQERGAAYIRDKRAAMLRMERGLGKTPTAVVDISAQIALGRVKKCLYIAPLSTLDHVRSCAREFATNLEPVVIMGDRAKRQRLLRGHGNLHIVNFEAVRILGQELMDAGYDMVVVDESYRIKDSNTQVSRIIKAVGAKAAWRRCLTGMIFAESIEDAWNQFDFLDRQVFPQGFYPFRARYCVIEKVEVERIKKVFNPKNGRKEVVFEMVGNPAQTGPAPMIPDPFGSDLMIPDPNWGSRRVPKKEKIAFQKVVGAKNIEEFTARIAPYVYNAEKKECLPELPDKTYQVLKVRMTEEQAKVYSRIMRDIRTEVGDHVIDHKWALSKIQKLHQVASGFVYDNEKAALHVPSGKFEELTDVLETSLKEAEKAVIFTAFKAEPPMVAEAVRGMSCPIKVFVLPENPRDRQPEIDRWTKWSMCPAVFIANVASGGVGLNLQAAHTAIFFSNDYKLEGREQAEDRVHRMGSEVHNKINIIDLVTEGTVDEDILEALRNKKSVVDVFLSRLRKECEE